MMSVSQYENVNCYGIVGVQQNVNPDELSKAFHVAALEKHPDKNPRNPNATKEFQELSDAHSLLQDPILRAQYDEANVHFLNSTFGRPSKRADVQREQAGRATAQAEFKAPKQKPDMSWFGKNDGAPRQSRKNNKLPKDFERGCGQNTGRREPSHGFNESFFEEHFFNHPNDGQSARPDSQKYPTSSSGPTDHKEDSDGQLEAEFREILTELLRNQSRQMLNQLMKELSKKQSTAVLEKMLIQILTKSPTKQSKELRLILYYALTKLPTKQFREVLTGALKEELREKSSEKEVDSTSAQPEFESFPPRPGPTKNEKDSDKEFDEEHSNEIPKNYFEHDYEGEYRPDGLPPKKAKWKRYKKRVAEVCLFAIVNALSFTHINCRKTNAIPCSPGTKRTGI